MWRNSNRNSPQRDLRVLGTRVLRWLKRWKPRPDMSPQRSPATAQSGSAVPSFPSSPSSSVLPRFIPMNPERSLASSLRTPHGRGGRGLQVNAVWDAPLCRMSRSSGDADPPQPHPRSTGRLRRHALSHWAAHPSRLACAPYVPAFNVSGRPHRWPVSCARRWKAPWTARRHRVDTHLCGAGTAPPRGQPGPRELRGKAPGAEHRGREQSPPSPLPTSPASQ